MKTQKIRVVLRMKPDDYQKLQHLADERYQTVSGLLYSLYHPVIKDVRMSHAPSVAPVAVPAVAAPVVPPPPKYIHRGGPRDCQAATLDVRWDPDLKDYFPGK